MAISPNDPLAVRLDELGYTDLSDSFEEMKICARGAEISSSRICTTARRNRRPGRMAWWPRRTFIFLIRIAQLRYVGRIDDSEVKTVTSQDAQRPRGAGGGEESTGGDDKSFWLLDQVGGQERQREKSIAKWDAEPVKISPIDAEAVKAIGEK